MQTEKVKILFVINKLGYGGAEKMLTFLANKLSQKDSSFNVVVYTFESDTVYYKLDENVRYIPEKRIFKTRKIRRFVHFLQISNVIHKEKPSVVISFLSNPNMLSILATRLSRTSVIISERGDPYQAKGLLNAFVRYLYNFSDGAVFQTDGAKDYYCRALQKKSCVIPNPVTFTNKDIEEKPKKRNEIAFVARFELRQKRQDIMLFAFKKVVEIFPDVKLIFYGDGPDEQKVKDLSQQLNLSANVEFAGLVQDVRAVIEKSKIFVLTSDYEGIPNALIEAMAIGLPVVSTDCSPGGAKMLIETNVNGILVPIGDIDAIANAVLFLLSNPQIAEQYGLEATKIISKFAPTNIIDMWEQYVEKIIKGKG